MKSLLYCLFFVLVFSFQNLSAQSSTDGGYRAVNVVALLTKTYNYRDSVEASGGNQVYRQVEKCYFEGIYKGKRRKVTNPLLTSPNQPSLASMAYAASAMGLPKEEVLIEVEGEKIWVALSANCEKSFFEEVKVGRKVQVLATFIAEHTANRKLFTAFVMSACFE
ncbi:MAG: hypothetical protein ACKVTZ_18575 [Bacteroidia bacterium]